MFSCSKRFSRRWRNRQTRNQQNMAAMTTAFVWNRTSNTIGAPRPRNETYQYVMARRGWNHAVEVEVRHAGGEDEDHFVLHSTNGMREEPLGKARWDLWSPTQFQPLACFRTILARQLAILRSTSPPAVARIAASDSRHGDCSYPLEMASRINPLRLFRYVGLDRSMMCRAKSQTFVGIALPASSETRNLINSPIVWG